MNPREYRNFLEKGLKELSRCKRVMDAGGGSGTFNERSWKEYKELFKNTDIVCVDIDKNRGADIVADLHNLSMVKDNSFDGILAYNVLEHTYNPFKVVEEFYRILKPKGVLLVEVPFIYPYHHFESNLGAKKTKLGSEKINDYYRFSQAGIRYLLKDFKKVEVNLLGNYSDVLLMFVLGFKIGSQSKVFNFLRKIVSFFARFFVKQGVMFEGTSLGVMAIARK